MAKKSRPSRRSGDRLLRLAEACRIISTFTNECYWIEVDFFAREGYIDELEV